MSRFNTLFFKLLTLVLSTLLIFSIIIYIAFTNIGEKILLDQIHNNAMSNLEFTAKDLENYSTQVTDAMLKINNSSAFKKYLTLTPNTPLEYTNMVLNLSEYLNTYKNYLTPNNSHIIVSSIPGSNARHYSSNSIKWDSIPENIVSNYMTINNKIPNKILYHGSKELFVSSSPYKNCIFATKPLIDISDNQMYGYAMLVIDERNLYEKYAGYLTNGVSISIIKSDSTILSSSDESSILNKNIDLLKTAQKTSNSDNHIFIDKKNNVSYLSIYIPLFDSFLLEKIDHNIAFYSFYNIRSNIIKITCFSFIILAIIVFFISKHITKPLSSLVETMKSSSSAKLTLHKSKQNNTNETQILIDTYNNLIQELDDYVKRLLKEQNHRQRSELMALQMQINPHFLYNTLSSIKYLAHTGKISQVDDTIQSLILMLKATIGSTDETITISKEIELLKNYTYINQIRFGEQISVELDVSDDCLNLMVPKLIIQPFVENAFFHAFADRPSGIISIFIRKNEFLTIEIIDNGIGISIDELVNIPKKRHFTGIGIHNVDERIKMLYGDNYGVDILSEAGFGTSVKITLPIIYSDRCDKNFL